MSVREPKLSPPARVKFRERGTSVTRLEGFSDAVFAFALTLLVVSLQVPTKFSELFKQVQPNTFVPFGLCFALFILIWYEHYSLFRRYGLEDRISILLNSLLLFVVLFFVFPLKFLFSISFQTGDYRFSDVSTLYIMYGLGFATIYVIFALFYLNAIRQRDSLELTKIEAFDTWSDAWGNLSMAAVGIGSVLLALFPATIGIAGLFYFVIAITRSLYEMLSARRRRALEKGVAASVGTGG